MRRPSSGCRTSASASSPRSATCSTACSCTSAARPGSTPPSCTRRGSCPMHKIDDHVREVTLDLIYDRRRDDYDPLTELMALFEGVDADGGGAGGPLRLARRATARAPHHRRQPRRPRDRPRGAAAVAPGAVDRQRGAARGHEGRRRPVRQGRDAAAVRAPERGDDEGGGRATSSPTWRRPTPAARAASCSAP